MKDGELAEVLSRPRLRAKYPDLTDQRRDQLLAVIRHLAEIVSDVPQTVLLARDPDDEPYVNLAVAAGAGYLVTWAGAGVVAFAGAGARSLSACFGGWAGGGGAATGALLVALLKTRKDSAEMRPAPSVTSSRTVPSTVSC